MAHLPAILALENGITIAGKAIGAIGAEASGELVFNTAMSGYQEILTDPSYNGQIVTFTYPHIGNYGVNDADVESSKMQAAGLVVTELSKVVSNYRANRTLQQYLEEYGVAGIEGVDTRRITRILRTEGAMRCVIAHGDNLNAEELVAKAKSIASMEGLDLTPYVTSAAMWESGAQAWASGEEGFEYGERTAGSNRYKVAAIDYGMKRNILRQLVAHGCDVTVFPATATSEQILALNPDGVFLSNGPGDPAAVAAGIKTTRELLGKKPMFGICLGHQILGLAIGATTYKLKFGHRGANHPVKNLETGEIEITSQNHGFAVDPSSLPASAEVTHVNLNDNTCAGLRIPSMHAFSVQYHPEASPGPHDSDYLFKQFVEMMEEQK